MVSVGLKGCIQMVQLDSTERDILNDNIDTKGVTPGCPEVCTSLSAVLRFSKGSTARTTSISSQRCFCLQDVVRVASFQADSARAYIAADPVDVNSNMHFTLKLRTKRSNAMVVYTADDSQVKTRLPRRVEVRLSVAMWSFDFPRERQRWFCHKDVRNGTFPSMKSRIYTILDTSIVFILTPRYAENSSQMF